jgi:hypothetical protein
LVLSNGGTLAFKRGGNWHERRSGYYYSLDGGYIHPEPGELIAFTRTMGVLAVSDPDGDLIKPNPQAHSTQPSTWTRRGGMIDSGGRPDLILEGQTAEHPYVRDVTLALGLRVADRVVSIDIPAVDAKWRPSVWEPETWHRPMDGLIVRASVDPDWLATPEDAENEQAGEAEKTEDNRGAGFHVHYDTIVEFSDKMADGGPAVINAIAVYDDGSTSKPYMCSGPGSRGRHRFKYGFPGGAESERKIVAIRVFYAPSSHLRFVRLDFDRFNLPVKPE